MSRLSPASRMPRGPASVAVVGNPAARILEQPDAADALALGEHETVMAVLRHDDQVAAFDEHPHPAVVARTDVEDAFAFEHEADFVVVVKVLVDELGADRV